MAKCLVQDPKSDAYKESKMVQNFTNSYSPEEMIFLGLELIDLFDLICQSLDIKILWSLWDKNADLVLKEIQNKNSIIIDDNIETVIREYENLEDHPHYFQASDNAHPGIKKQNLYARNFLHHIKEKGYF
jgi:hypothetical protein